MVPKRVARRYAEAFLETGEEQKSVDAIAADFEFLREMIRSMHDFAVFLRSPVVKKEKKKEILRELFAKRLNGLTQSFLALLAEKGREDSLTEIIAEFMVLRDARRGIVHVDVRSAVDLSSDHSKRLQMRFGEIAKSNVALSTVVDPSLIGGVVARIGDTVYDGSVKRQLELLRQRFESEETNVGI